MEKLIFNSSKKIEIISNGGRYKLEAKMKVDYDFVNDFFGARFWVFKVFDLKLNKKVNLQKNGVNCFEKTEYQYKRDLLKIIQDIGIFSQAINNLKI